MSGRTWARWRLGEKKVETISFRGLSSGLAMRPARNSWRGTPLCIGAMMMADRQTWMADGSLGLAVLYSDGWREKVEIPKSDSDVGRAECRICSCEPNIKF
jgi:hypothetical protein